jgi:hypothetical protein
MIDKNPLFLSKERKEHEEKSRKREWKFAYNVILLALRFLPTHLGLVDLKQSLQAIATCALLQCQKEPQEKRHGEKGTFFRTVMKLLMTWIGYEMLAFGLLLFLSVQVFQIVCGRVFHPKFSEW